MIARNRAGSTPRTTIALRASARTAKPAPQNGLERILYFSDGKMAGSLFIEPCSPPSGPEAGSLKVGEVKQ